MWGWWAAAYFPEEGLKEYHDYIRSGKTNWKEN